MARQFFSDIDARGSLTVAKDVSVSCAGSSAATPRVLGMTNLTGGTAARWQFGDPYSAVQNGNGTRMAVYSYHSLELIGNRRNSSSTPAFTTGSATDAGIIMTNTTATAPVLWMVGAASQSSDFLSVRTSTGTVLAAINSAGTLNLGSASASTGKLSFYSASSAFSASIQADTTSPADYTLTLPPAVPGSTAFLKVATSGAMSYDTATYLTSATGHYQQGFENQTDSTLGFVPATRVFTLAPTGSTFRIWRTGIQYDLGTKTVTLPNVTGLYFITLDGSNNLVASTTAWSIVDDIPVAAVYYYVPTVVGTLIEERHGARRNRDWHLWAHTTIGTRYESGGTGTFGNSSLSVTQFIIHDEDIVFNSGSTATTCRVWRYSSANTAMFFSNETVPYLANAGALQYDNSGTPTNVSSSNYVINDVYAATDSVVPIFVRVGGAQYSTLGNAQAALGTPTPWQNVATTELKLLYQVIYRNQGGTPTFIQRTDYRTGGSVPGGGTGTVAPHAATHAGVGSDPITTLGSVTFTGSMIGPASTTALVPLVLPHGATPTTGMVDGAVWTETTGIYARINGTTVGPLGTGGGSPALTATYVGYGNGSNVLTGDANFTWASNKLSLTSAADAIILQLTGANSVQPAFTIQAAAVSTGSGSGKLFDFKVTGDSTSRGMFYNDGKYGIGGGGAGGRDVFLSRAAANVMRISNIDVSNAPTAGHLHVYSNLYVGTALPASPTGTGGVVFCNLANTVTLAASASTSASYTLTLPTATPATTAFMRVSNTGVMSYDTATYATAADITSAVATHNADADTAAHQLLFRKAFYLAVAL